jgi:antitoxin ParD1/3/4
MTITLPDALRGWIETQVQLGGHPSVDACVETILREKQQRVRQETEKSLIEGLDSGDAIDVDEGFWVERRQVLVKRLKDRAKEPA